LRQQILETGNACQFVAMDSGKWQRLPVCGIDFGQVAGLATNWHRLPESGKRCRAPKSATGKRQALPLSQIRRRKLASAAGFPNPLPETGKRRRRVKTSAGLRQPPPDLGGRRGRDTGLGSQLAQAAPSAIRPATWSAARRCGRRSDPPRYTRRRMCELIFLVEEAPEGGYVARSLREARPRKSGHLQS
jgi:hypothetical protein